jgi:hypothetical protein
MNLPKLFLVNGRGFTGNDKPISNHDEKLLPAGILPEEPETRSPSPWDNIDKLYPTYVVEIPKRMQDQENAEIEKLLPPGMLAPCFDCD